MKIILLLTLYITVVFPSMSQDSFNSIQLEDEKISEKEIQKAVLDKPEINWREIVLDDFNQNDLNNQDNLTEEEIQKWMSLKKIVDQQFFDYNYISAFNTTLEEIAMNEINRIGKFPLKNTRTGELYSIYIAEIRAYYGAKRSIWKTIEKNFGLPMWDRLLEFEFDNGMLAVIPVANSHSVCTELIIYVFKNKKNILNFHYSQRNKFEKYPINAKKIKGRKVPDKEFVLSQFLFFDKIIFQYSGCDIIDEYNELLDKDNKTTTNSVSCLYDSFQNETLNCYEVIQAKRGIKRVYNFSAYTFE